MCKTSEINQVKYCFLMGLAEFSRDAVLGFVEEQASAKKVIKTIRYFMLDIFWLR